VHRVAGRQPGLAAHGRGLLPVLPDAADEDVVHGAGVDAVALDERRQQLREQVHRVYPGQRAALLAAAHRGADEVNDDSTAHDRCIAHNVSNY